MQICTIVNAVRYMDLKRGPVVDCRCIRSRLLRVMSKDAKVFFLFIQAEGREKALHDLYRRPPRGGR